MTVADLDLNKLEPCPFCKCNELRRGNYRREGDIEGDPA